MSEKPKRRWFQIHLSTLLLLSMLGSLAIIQSLKMTSTVGDSSTGGWKGVSYSAVYSIGWPRLCYFKGRMLAQKSEYDEITMLKPPENAPPITVGEFFSMQPQFSYILWESLAFNIIVTVVILFGIAFTCECAIRRREARKS